MVSRKINSAFNINRIRAGCFKESGNIDPRIRTKDTEGCIRTIVHKKVILQTKRYAKYFIIIGKNRKFFYFIININKCLIKIVI